MPKKKTDSSKLVSYDEARPWTELDAVAVRNLAIEFEIDDAEVLLRHLRQWSSIYTVNKSNFRDIPSLADQRDIYKQLGRDLSQAENALAALGDTTRRFLELAPEILKDDVSAKQGLKALHAFGLIDQSPMPFPDTIHVEPINTGLSVLRAACEARHHEILEKLRKKEPSLPPGRIMDMRVLVSSIREYFKSQFPDEPIGCSFDPNGEFGKAGHTPTNEYCRFTVECIRLVDPYITRSAIRDAITDEVAWERHLKDAAGKTSQLSTKFTL